MDDQTQPTQATLIAVLVHTSDGGKVPKDVTPDQAADLASRFHVEVINPDGGPSLPWADYLAAKPAAEDATLTFKGVPVVFTSDSMETDPRKKPPAAKKVAAKKVA